MHPLAAWLVLNGWEPRLNTIGNPSMVNDGMVLCRFTIPPVYRMMPGERVQFSYWMECTWEDIPETELEGMYAAVQRGVWNSEY